MDSIQTKSLLQLPIGPLNNILSKLQMEDLKSSCLVSRGFYELITTNPKIIKRLFLKVTFTQDNQEEELEAITNTHRVFHNMKIQSLVYHDVPSFRSKEHNRKVLAKFGKSIKEIIIIGIGMFPVSAVIAFFPNIVSATIENCIDPEQENEQLYSYTLTNTLLPFDKLKSLCLDNCAVSGFSHATKLESFTVIRCKTLEFDVYVRHHRFNNDNFIETLKNSQATLKNLKVEEFHFSYRDGCQPQLSLTKLSLSKPNIFDVLGENLSQAQFIIDFLRTQNKLQYLRLGLSAVTNEYIIEPIAKMHELKSLELVVNREYKHIKFESINRSVENLKIEYEPDNSFEGYFGASHAIVNSFPAIKDLELHITRGNDNEEEQLLNFNKLKHLQNLRMYVKYMESFTNMHFHQLTELHMVYCSDGDWNIFTKRNPNVKSLTINKMEVLSVDNIKVITSNWKLEELVLEFIHPTSYNPGLNHPEGVDMEILQVILENGNHLKKLKVGLKGDKKNFMGVLAKFEPKLKLMEAELVLCSKFP